ncbi:MAG: MarR family transcriptional regulator [Prolixibacteraceae bacterium]|nr:MarR family transcriptional regulator [Prolixibacteraceae bacterium]
MQKHRNKMQKSAGRIIGELSRAASIYFKSEFRKYSIGHAQIVTLLHISRHEGITQKELAKELNLDKSSITSQLCILEKNGYIIRLTDQKDARIHQIMITDKSRELLVPLKNIFSSWSRILLDGFSEEEKEEAFRLLEKMRENSRARLKHIKAQQ